MNPIEKLASALGRRDEVPNQELAREIVDANDKKAVKEIIENLTNKSKDIQNDCIKVIYEIGEMNPKLISGYYAELIELLDSKNNRMQWGAMTAINTIALEKPEVIYESLPKLVETAEKGTVITKDHLMAIMVKLCSIPKYTEDVFSLYNELLLASPNNQMPTYAENILPFINAKNKVAFLKTLTSRVEDIESDIKRKRIEKVIAKVSK